jgi:hypothetical protein
MAVNVREHASECQATCLSPEFRLNVAMSTPFGPTYYSHLAPPSGRECYFDLAPRAGAGVSWPLLTAIWADSDHRKAAFDVLDRLLPWRR